MAVVDLMTHDGLTCSFTGVQMGVYGDVIAEEMKISREKQDEWALRSHERTIAAMEDRNFCRGNRACRNPAAKGWSLLIIDDEGTKKGYYSGKTRSVKACFSTKWDHYSG